MQLFPAQGTSEGSFVTSLTQAELDQLTATTVTLESENGAITSQGITNGDGTHAGSVAAFTLKVRDSSLDAVCVD